MWVWMTWLLFYLDVVVVIIADVELFLMMIVLIILICSYDDFVWFNDIVVIPVMNLFVLLVVDLSD